MMNSELIPSGCYMSYGHLKPVEMLIKAWEQDARRLISPSACIWKAQSRIIQK